MCLLAEIKKKKLLKERLEIKNNYEVEDYKIGSLRMNVYKLINCFQV